MRHAQFAGLFYEKGENSLTKQLDWCFTSERGPGDMPSEKTKEHLQAILVPHAGYTYSGPCAAWAYKALAEAEFPDLFILIGPSHKHEESGFSAETFETPFGFVRVNQEFAKKLAEKGNIKQNENIFEGEHCLEVQLPFLQHVFRDKVEQVRILPLLISHDADLKAIAVDIKETLVETGLKAMYIVTSDFTHYGPNYKYVPFTSDVKKNIYDLDRGAIELIKANKPQEFLKYVEDNLMTMCGALPVVLLLNAIRPKKILLEHYYTSGDVLNSYKNSVSYASFVFR